MNLQGHIEWNHQAEFLQLASLNGWENKLSTHRSEQSSMGLVGSGSLGSLHLDNFSIVMLQKSLVKLITADEQVQGIQSNSIFFTADNDFLFPLSQYLFWAAPSFVSFCCSCTMTSKTPTSLTAWREGHWSLKLGRVHNKSVHWGCCSFILPFIVVIWICKLINSYSSEICQSDFYHSWSLDWWQLMFLHHCDCSLDQWSKWSKFSPNISSHTHFLSSLVQ